MPTSLVIVESPAKCKKIESYLGPGYKVIASFGHIRNIPDLKSIDVDNNFHTNYDVINEPLKLKQIEKIRSEIANANEVILATDDDREGEAIAWHICQLFSLSVQRTKRIIFHEITESALVSAISHPKTINMNLVYAQQARQILDMLVGYTITPILWNCVVKNHTTSLSAGRCQTPALRIVYDNYLDIKKSPGKIVYNASGYFTNLNLVFDLNKSFESKEESRIFLEKCTDFDFTLTTTQPKKVIKKSPEPLTTSSLQQLASNELHLSPKETMKYAQQLYESGYITYMRTDSKKYSKDFVDNIKKYIINVYGEQYVNQNIEGLVVGSMTSVHPPEKKKKSVGEKKGIPPPQEAHEAIRPVNINVCSPSLQDSTDDLQAKAIRLYDLIWKRTLESCMPSSQYNSISAKITAPLDSEFIYKTEQNIFPGWQIVNKVENSDTYAYINGLKQNINMTPKKIDIKFTMIDLKSHYTEARLVQILEEKGIGRPSTFASLIDKIQERKYVEKQNITGKSISCSDFSMTENGNITELNCTKEFGNEKNKLVITPLGIIVIEFLVEKFDSFFDYDYTKQMEDELDKISQGINVWSDLCKDCNNELTKITRDLADLKKFSIQIDNKHSLIIGKHGPVIKCIDTNNPQKVSFLPVKKNLDLEQLKYASNVSLEDVIDTNTSHTTSDSIGKYKGLDLFIKKGKYGIYAQWGTNKQSLKEEYGNTPIEHIQYLQVIRFLEKDKVLDPSKPVGLVRELNEHLSIRTGKFGDYIFYKKPRMKKAEFFKLKDFKGDYRNCEKVLLLNWIKLTYKVE